MSKENVEVVKATFARSSRGDFDGLLALFHPGWNGSKTLTCQARSPTEVTPRSSGTSKACPGTGRSCGSSPSDLSTTGMRFWPSLG
jgi:hypothetical protein